MPCSDLQVSLSRSESWSEKSRDVSSNDELSTMQVSYSRPHQPLEFISRNVYHKSTLCTLIHTDISSPHIIIGWPSRFIELTLLVLIRI